MTQTKANLPPQVHLVRHPLMAHMLTQVRDQQTHPALFRELVGRMATLLAWEATRDLALQDRIVSTPMQKYTGDTLAQPVTIVSILRAGLGMSEGVQRLLPEAAVGHLGMFRDEVKLSPVSYYESLPPQIRQGPVLLVDPMLATAGSAMAAVSRLRDRGCHDIRFLCLIAAPEGIAHFCAHDADVPIHVAAIDERLNDVGYILPGLGDAGDRLFGTLEKFPDEDQGCGMMSEKQI